MKVLCINKNFHIRGGADRYYFQTMDVLRQHGHEVIPFSTVHPNNIPSQYSSYFSRFGDSGDDLRTMSFVRKLIMSVNGVYSFEAARQLERIIIATQPQIAHVHNILYHLTPSIFPILRKYGIPVVQSLHDWHIICSGGHLYTRDSVCERCKGGKIYNCTLYRCYKGSLRGSFAASVSKYVDSLFKLWVNGTDMFVVPGSHMIEKLCEWGFPRHKFYIIPNPFSLKGITPSYTVGDYVVWYGALLKLKGVYTVLRAARELPQIKFEMYGSGTEEVGIKNFIAEHSLKNVILDTTTKWGPKLQERIANALCVIDPAEWYHPSQYVLWESLALSKAVIASDIGGAPDMIEDGVNGALFEPGNWVQLASKILQLKDNPQTALDWGRVAREKIEVIVEKQLFYYGLMEAYRAAFAARGVDPL